MDIKINLKDEFQLSYKEFILTNENSRISLRLGLDRLFIKYGIGFNVIPVYSYKSNKILGYKSKMKIYPINFWNLESEEINVIEDFKYYKSLSKAEKITTLFVLKYLEEKLNNRDGIHKDKM